MKRISPIIALFFISILLPGCNRNVEPNGIKATGVWFETSDEKLQQVFDLAEKTLENNVRIFDGYTVLVEGGGYNNVWLETQPMGGVMYAKRNIEIARNNVEIFIDHQRSDGRIPAMIRDIKGFTEQNLRSLEETGRLSDIVRENRSTLNPEFMMFQGNCFPIPAFELYFWLNKDKAYLKRLYDCLEKWDEYLWLTRDSNGNGCLETWCYWDTGEDNSTRFGLSPTSWPFEFPPLPENILKLSMPQNSWDFMFVYQVRKMTPEQKEQWNNKEGIFNEIIDQMPVPMQSMDIMSYSYSNRDVLSLISGELGNGKELFWREKAEEVRKKIREYLWDEDRKACFDRDKDNKVMDILIHNNLRCMWYGSFDQEMADAFVNTHLLNPDAFWTPFPLPSIAINDPYFRNEPNNNWSGQPQGLTYQRSIRALENYGHYSTLTRLGRKFLDVSGQYMRFTQQYDPFTGIPGDRYNQNYGPSTLAALEFISRLYGIDLKKDEVYWSCLDNDNDYTYSQQWGEKIFSMVAHGDRVVCSINGREMFSFTKGARIVSNLKGRPEKVIGIETETKSISINFRRKNLSLDVEPDHTYLLD